MAEAQGLLRNGLMGYRLVEYTPDWKPAVARSNARLLASGQAPFLLPGDALAQEDPHAPVRRQHQLVIDDADEVRGGCLFQHHRGWVDGETTPVLNVQSPLSEGLFDPKFAGVGPWMMRETLRRREFTYCVGMGGEQLPFPRLLRALGWRVEPVPFYFRVLAGRRFLANMQTLRKHPKLGGLARAGGAIPLLSDWACGLAHRFRTEPRERGLPQPGPASWQAVRTRYGFGIDRGEASLDVMYPTVDACFHRIRVPGGLGILRVNRFAKHNYFGNLTVATLAEALCEPAAIRPLLRAAVDEARRAGAGLLVTNQSAPDMQSGLRSEGWFSFASNFLVGLSPKLAGRIAQQPFYVTRGDGDGLLNL